MEILIFALIFAGLIGAVVYVGYSLSKAYKSAVKEYSRSTGQVKADDVEIIADIAENLRDRIDDMLFSGVPASMEVLENVEEGIQKLSGIKDLDQSSRAIRQEKIDNEMLLADIDIKMANIYEEERNLAMRIYVTKSYDEKEKLAHRFEELEQERKVIRKTLADLSRKCGNIYTPIRIQLLYPEDYYELIPAAAGGKVINIKNAENHTYTDPGDTVAVIRYYSKYDRKDCNKYCRNRAVGTIEQNFVKVGDEVDKGTILMAIRRCNRLSTREDRIMSRF